MRFAPAVIALAAVGLSLGGCGADSARPPVEGEPVRAQDGAFTTLTPPGFDAAQPNLAAGSEQAELVMHRQTSGGDVFAAIIVTKPPHTSGTLEQQVAKTRREFLKSPDISKVSAPRKLRVNGEPALALTFVSKPKAAPPTPNGDPAPAQQAELITVIHKGTTHTILYGAPPASFDSLRSGLDRVISAWQWTP